MPSKSKKHFWILALLVALGASLRLVFPNDIEYKSDETYMVESVRHETSWPELGMPSGVQLRNPGLSIGAFVGLAKVAGLGTDASPPEVARLVQIVNSLTLLAFAFWIFRAFGEAGDSSERELWLWALAFACVNPVFVTLTRKIWAQSLLPPFSLALALCWRRLDSRWRAFFFGLISALVGQIHMSGFFFAAVLWAGAAIQCFRKRETARWSWGFSVLGAALGTVPMIPWIRYILAGRASTSAQGLRFPNLFDFRFWTEWLGSASGANLPTNLGHREDFLKYLAFPFGSYLGAVALGLALVAGLAILGLRIRGSFARSADAAPTSALAPASRLYLRLGFWGYGAVMSLAPFRMHPHYLPICFPLVFLAVADWALGAGNLRRGRRLLTALWIANFVSVVLLLAFLRVNGGAKSGDFGDSYRVQKAASAPN